MKRLLVVQPYLAAYRRDFYLLLTDRLAERGVELTVAIGQPDAVQSARGDSVSLGNTIVTASKSLKVIKPVVRWQSSWRVARGYDAVIMEASGSLLDTSIALLSRRPTGVWGHIDSFTGPQNRVDSMIEGWQLRRAKAVLAYTPRGRVAAEAQGVSADRVIVLNNTINTASLASQVEQMTRAEADQILGTHGWERNKTFAFIGGLDSSKRLEFLAGLLDELATSHPDAHLLVAGRGEMEHVFAQASERGQVRMLGRVGDREKAALAKVAGSILMPGRVGLIAVDSLTLGLPIITTDWPYHAPEFEYLTPGKDCLVAENSFDAYVQAVRDVLDQPDLLIALQECSARAKCPTLDSMVEQFVAGCMHLLS